MSSDIWPERTFELRSTVVHMEDAPTWLSELQVSKINSMIAINTRAPSVIDPYILTSDTKVLGLLPIGLDGLSLDAKLCLRILEIRAYTSPCLTLSFLSLPNPRTPWTGSQELIITPNMAADLLDQLVTWLKKIPGITPPVSYER